MRSVGVVVVTLLLAACGSTGGSGTVGAGPGGSTTAVCPDTSTWDGGALGRDQPEPAPLPDGIVPTGVLRCSVEWQDIEGEGSWSVLVASWADSGLDRFVAELRKPDQAPTEGVCAAVYIATPWFVLVTADGRVVRAAVPSGACGHPRASALEALAGLPWTVLSETRLRQNETPEAQAAGCPQNSKDMVAITAADGSGRPAADAPVLGGSAPSRVRVCVYASDGTPADETPGGDFRSGRILKGPALAAAFADLESAPAAESCSARATAFAVLMPVDKDVLNVELDGCGRVLTEAGELRQAPPALLAALR